MTRTTPQSAGPLRCRRLWLFRAGAVLLGLSLFGVVELACLLFDVGRPADYDDPFVGFSEVHPLFVLNETENRYEIPESRRDFFAAESFPAEKRPETFRVFCLGGSTVQGRPFSTPTSFTTWLELSLTAAEPGRNWEVVNCGGISYASYRLVPILEECLQYQPDLFILCTGHNEFLEDRTYDHIKYASEWWRQPMEWASQSRTFTLARHAVQTVTGTTRERTDSDKPVLKSEVDALLDYKRGIKAYDRDPEWRRGVVAHYRFNVRRMIALARNAGVPVVLVRPPSNLADCPPFKSQHRDGLSRSDLERWQALMDEAQSHYGHDLPTAVRLLKRAIDIDDQYAGTFYELGKCYEALGLHRQAREAYLQARDLDVCPLRMIRPLEEALAEVAEQTDTPLVDSHRLLEAECPNGILGDRMLVDHVHPTVDGHQEIANALTEEMARQGWVDLRSGWESARDAAYEEHLESLKDIYFLRGQETLRALRAWTQGRADGPPIESRRPSSHRD